MIWRYILVAACLAIVVYAVIGQARSHSFYSFECCSDKDCSPTTAVQWSDAGWVVAATGETVPFGDSRIKESPDVQFHACVYSFAKRIRCLYVPGPGI